MRLSKKAQEEIVGFVVVVVIVVVAGVILLGLMLMGNDSVQNKSIDIKHFLESAYRVNTPCLRIDSSLENILIECYRDSGNSCQEGQNVCVKLNETFKEIMTSTWKVGPGYPNTGYGLRIVYLARDNSTSDITALTEGVCNESFMMHEYIVAERLSKGNLITELKICS